MSKKNIGATLALYPCLAAHSHLTVSLVQAHYINKGIRETGKRSVNIVVAKKQRFDPTRNTTVYESKSTWRTREICS